MTDRLPDNMGRRGLDDPQQRVAVDLTALDRNSPADPDLIPVRFVRAMSQQAPTVEFIVLACAGQYAGLAHLDAANVSRLVVAGPGPVEEVLARVGARLPGHTRRAQVARRLGRSRKLRGVYRRWRPGVLARLQADVVFCPFTASNVFDPGVPLVAAVHDLQHVSHPHLLTSRERAVRARAFDTIASYANRVVCSATEVRAVAVRCKDVVPERVVTLPPGRLLTGPTPARSEIAQYLARLGLRETEFLLVLGDADARANHRFVLTALGIARARQPQMDVPVVFAGRPDRGMADLRLAVERMGLSGLVRFSDTFSLKEHAMLIQGCRAVVVPSLYDALGEVVLDAMTAGRAILCSELPALVELTAGAALLFDPHRPGELAAAIERIDHQPNLLDELAQRGRVRLAKLGDAASIAHEYLSLFRETRAAWPASP